MINAVPFELNREPQIVLGIVDGKELIAVDEAQTEDKGNGNPAASSIRHLQAQLITSGDYGPNVSVKRLVIFDYAKSTSVLEDVLTVTEAGGKTSTRGVLAEIGGLFLDSAAQSAKAWENDDIRSPQTAMQTPQPGSRISRQVSSPARPIEGNLQERPSSRAGTPTPASLTQSASSSSPVVVCPPWHFRPLLLVHIEGHPNFIC